MLPGPSHYTVTVLNHRDDESLNANQTDAAAAPVFGTAHTPQPTINGDSTIPLPADSDALTTRAAHLKKFSFALCIFSVVSVGVLGTALIAISRNQNALTLMSVAIGIGLLLAIALFFAARRLSQAEPSITAFNSYARSLTLIFRIGLAATAIAIVLVALKAGVVHGLFAGFIVLPPVSAAIFLTPLARPYGNPKRPVSPGPDPDTSTTSN